MDEDCEIILLQEDKEVARWVGIQINDGDSPRALIGLDATGEGVSCEWKERYDGNKMEWTSERISAVSKPSTERVFNDLDNIVE